MHVKALLDQQAREDARAGAEIEHARSLRQLQRGAHVRQRLGRIRRTRRVVDVGALGEALLRHDVHHRVSRPAFRQPRRRTKQRKLLTAQKAQQFGR